jgi:glycosyltransferase involved in cell wall biosynthesis
MRFLMLNWRDLRNPLSGGAERVTHGYLAALQARGHEVVWFANAFPGGSREEEVEGLRVIRGGDKGTSIWEAWKWCRGQARFDLVIDQHHGIPWFAPWWSGTHCVAYIHEVLGPIWDVFYNWPKSVIGKWQERRMIWLYRNVQFWTASSTTRQMLESIGVRRVQQIPYGVDTEALPALDPKPTVRPIRLIAVSRLAPNKRVDHCIQAIRCLADHGVGARLTVVGDGACAADLRRLATDLGLQHEVEFTGPLSETEKDARMREAHLLVHASMREGWGLNVIEANAMGTPAVVYPVAGLVEATLDSQTGVVAAEETPAALAEAVLKCVQEPAVYARYRVAAWERARTFHWNQVLPPACEWLEAQARGQPPSAVH